MWQFLQRSLTTIFILLIVGGITFGASQAFGSPRVSLYCGELEEDLGCCPPFSQGSCFWTCWQLGYALGGACLSWEPAKGEDCKHCCTCIDR